MEAGNIMSKTKSELLLERFCRENSIRFDRLEPDNVQKTPDYDVFPEGNRVMVEVKELTPNKSEKAVFEKARLQGSAGAACDPRARIRQKISQANRQLRARSNGTVPTLLVLYDNGTLGGIDRTDVKNAMYGDETLRLTLSDNVIVGATNQLAGGRKCTPTDNRSLSAVAIVFFADSLKLSVFHNVFAKCPLPVGWFNTRGCRQFSINLDEVDGLPDWYEL